MRNAGRNHRNPLKFSIWPGQCPGPGLPGPGGAAPLGAALGEGATPELRPGGVEMNWETSQIDQIDQINKPLA